MKLLALVLIVCAVLATFGLALVFIVGASERSIYRQMEGTRNGAGYQ